MSYIVEGVNRFLRHSLLSYKALYGFYDFYSYLLIKIVNPILQLIFFCLLAKYAHGADSDLTPWILGNAFLLCTTNAFFGIGTVLANERQFGTLKMIMVSPTNKFLAFFAKSTVHLFDGLFSVVIGLLVGMLFFHLNLNHVNLGLLFLSIFVGMFAVSGMGLFISSFGLVLRDVSLVLNTGSIVLFALSGSNFSIEQLPVFIQKISYLLPLTRSIRAARLIVKGQSGVSISSLLLQEVLVGVVYILIGYSALHIMDRISRKRASLDVY